MKLIPLFSLALLALAGAAHAEDAPATPLAANEVTIHVGTIEDRKAVFATVESVRRTMARARIGGTVAELTVTEGSRVKAGEKIAAVGDAKLLAQLDANDQRTRQRQAERDQAEIDLHRAEALFASGSIAKARLDQARTAFQVAERGVGALRADRAVTAQQLSEGAVLAPVSGRVLTVPLAVGSVVLPGETLAVIATENYILRAELPERHARFIKTGDEVTVGEHEVEEPLGLQGKTLFRQAPHTGRVVKVYPEIKDGRVTADIAVDGLNDYFVGERVRVWVSTGTRPGIVIPAGYLFRRDGLAFVHLKGGVEVLVQPGRAVPDGIEILSGLHDGDVVTRP